MSISAEQAIETLETAAEENKLSALRHEQVVTLPAEGEVWMTGDIHDHRTNFNKFIRHADLGHYPHRHIVLHELIHGDHFDINGAEDSWQTLLRAAELKCDYSGQVHFLLANHDLAQIHGEGIMKAGLSVCEAFTKGIKRDFGDGHAGVTVAVTEFLLTLPLAIRCPNGLFFCHSIPTDGQLENFDYTIFDRPLTGPDYKRRTGPVYQLIWGRNTTPQAAGNFADKVGATIVVTGHQSQEVGYGVNGDRNLILASEHNQGVFLPLDLAQNYDMPGLVSHLKRFVALDV